MNGPRPGALLVVVGTGTDVGKTWVSAAVLSGFRSGGWSVAARKPAQSFEPGTGPTDAEVLAAATGEDAETVCAPHRWYEVPFAPPMAAEHLGRPRILQSELLTEISWPDPATSLGLVELAGGVASPVSSDGDPTELVAQIAPDNLILVAHAGLGTVNAVRLSVRCLTAAIATPVTVVLNRFEATDELHRRNALWLREVDGLEVLTSPAGDPSPVAGALVERLRPGHRRSDGD